MTAAVISAALTALSFTGPGGSVQSTVLELIQGSLKCGTTEANSRLTAGSLQSSAAGATLMPVETAS